MIEAASLELGVPFRYTRPGHRKPATVTVAHLALPVDPGPGFRTGTGLVSAAEGTLGLDRADRLGLGRGADTRTVAPNATSTSINIFRIAVSSFADKAGWMP